MSIERNQTKSLSGEFTSFLRVNRAHFSKITIPTAIVRKLEWGRQHQKLTAYIEGDTIILKQRGVTHE